jgi:hypothetical protein
MRLRHTSVNVSVVSTLGWYWLPNPEEGTEKPATHRDVPGDDLIQSPPATAAPPADCCIAQATYHVVLPPKGSRPRAAHLMLCAHHYRKCARGFRQSGAAVYSIDGHLVASPG